MEIRCGGCNKLFRVSDDKITGKGIKFACTRCGESVKITREDFDNYVLSQTAVSALDQFESKTKHVAMQAPGIEAKHAEGTEAVQPSVVSEANHAESMPVAPMTPDVPVSAAPDFLSEPSIFDEQSLEADTGHILEPEPVAAEETRQFELQGEEKKDFKQEARAEANEEPKPEPEQKPVPIPEPEPVSKKEGTPEPVPVPRQEPELWPKSVSKPEPQPGPKPAAKSELKPQPAQELKVAPAIPARPEPKPAGPPRPEPVRKAVAGVAASAGMSAPVKKEPARPAAAIPPVTVIGASPTQPARSGRIVLLISIIVIMLAGAGVFYYLRASQRTASDSTSTMTPITGLRIVSAAGSMEANGDLLIAGEIENTTDGEQRAWYIVVDVFDASGTVINKLRMVNGKQLFTRNDYDIMARRGMNVKELKAQALAHQGTVIPPKGKVPFEIRYLQPPIGVASFNTTLQPFDPIRMYQEMADEAK